MNAKKRNGWATWYHSVVRWLRYAGVQEIDAAMRADLMAFFERDFPARDAAFVIVIRYRDGGPMTTEGKAVTDQTAKRYYYKCFDCLSPMVSEERLDNSAECFCGGLLSYMGKVKQDGHVHHEYDATPCNTLCTDATGPNCNCSCGGKNHGVQRRADIRRDEDRGVAILTPPHKEKASAVATEYRAAKESAWQRLVAKWGTDLDTAAWIDDRSRWEAIMNDKAALRHARNMKVHAARMKALAKVGV